MLYSSQDCCAGHLLDPLTIGGDWLYLKTEQSRLEFAAGVTQTTTERETTDINARVLRPDFDYCSGYRIFADYLSPCQSWKFYTAFTHIPTKASKHFSSSGEGNFASMFIPNFPLFTPLQGDIFGDVSANWNAKIDYFLFDVYYFCELLSCFEIAPYIGLKGLWMDQKLHIQGSGLKSVGFKAKLSETFSSVGLNGGVQAFIYFCGFTLQGDVGTSMLYGYFKDKNLLLSGTEEEETISTYSFKNSQWYGLPTFDASIELSYAKCLGRFNLEAHIGWENHIIFNTNNLSIAGSGYTSIQGLKLGGSISF